MIGKQRSASILVQFTLIKSLFDRYYNDNDNDNDNDEDVVADIEVEIETLKDIIWHEVDIQTAEAMDKQDGLTRPIQESRHPSKFVDGTTE